MFYCLVVGSRDFNDSELLKRTLDRLLENHDAVTIISGGAKGADTLTEAYAVEHGYQSVIFKPDWKQYGRGAGIKRNEQMHQFIAEQDNRVCVAFWDGQSKGTQSNFKLAQKYNNPLRIIKF